MERLTKVCPRCKVEKQLSEYRYQGYHRNKQRLVPSAYCKPCEKERKREWERENKDWVNARARERHAPFKKYRGIAGVTKVCGKCGIEKPLDEFYDRKPTPRWKTTKRSECKNCSHQENTKRPIRKKRVSKNWKLRRKFGITLEQYEELWLKQNGQCAICGRDYSHDSMGHDLAVDHCHDTGEIRGLLCRHCNIGLGKLGDSVDGLMRAVKYLQKPRDKQYKNEETTA